MKLNPEGKELFWEICKQLNDLKFVVDTMKFERERVESVPFLFPSKIRSEHSTKNIHLQVAAVQYIGGRSSYEKNLIAGITLRIYLAPFRELGIEDIFGVENRFRSTLKGSSRTPYYDYVFDCNNYDKEDIIKESSKALSSLNEKLLDTIPYYSTLPIEKIPESIITLPKY
ncbi:hypothetical protein [Brevibacillus daliensis]|uniref:hypothetical protein n=1 Tax=Brevibacillus daliensis TaxID=2892995 RepID=UPI001E5D9406|nr:hypothetical protein [Brevibacillus daliensis]